MRALILTFCLFPLLLVSAIPPVALVQHVDPRKMASLLSAENAQEIADHYIIVFKQDTKEADMLTHMSLINEYTAAGDNANMNEIRHVYNLTMKGYSARLDSDLLDQVRSSSVVDYVERDQVVNAYEVQEDAPWGLARTSSRSKLGSKRDYYYHANAGEGICVYVIDTGIYVNHTDFEDRARWGITIPKNEPDDDTNGHGTHCSGTIAGKSYGVAKKANLVAIKVLDSNGSGTLSDVIAGIEWAVGDHKKAQQKATHRGSVANMSLGGGFSRALNSAVDAAVDAGIHFAVAAGNEDDDACNTSPASAKKVISVGASTIDDERAWFSNYGRCVTIFGPGLNIKSAWIGSPDATNTISGTSMASPHVAGALAYYLSQNAKEKPAPGCGETKEALKEQATKHALKKIGKKSPNLLLYNNPPDYFQSTTVAEPFDVGMEEEEVAMDMAMMMVLLSEMEQQDQPMGGEYTEMMMVM